jgi:hypothetical protein
MKVDAGESFGASLTDPEVLGWGELLVLSMLGFED